MMQARNPLTMLDGVPTIPSVPTLTLTHYAIAPQHTTQQAPVTVASNLPPSIPTFDLSKEDEAEQLE